MPALFVLLSSLFLMSSAPTWANVPKANIESAIRRDLASHRGTGFAKLIQQWEKAYASDAVAPLLRFAGERNRADADRYIALMAAAKLGGRDSAATFVPFLKDSSWMIRSAALNALSALKNPTTAKEVLSLLNDRALVVRTQAVAAVRLLKPEGAVPALMATLSQGSNYHGGKALWVPHRALEALAELKPANAAEISAQLKPLLSHEKDPALQARAIATLEILTGKNLNADADLKTRVTRWKAEL